MFGKGGADMGKIKQRGSPYRGRKQALTLHIQFPMLQPQDFAQKKGDQPKFRYEN